VCVDEDGDARGLFPLSDEALKAPSTNHAQAQPN
jgi:hypothetical protein